MSDETAAALEYCRAMRRQIAALSEARAAHRATLALTRQWWAAVHASDTERAAELDAGLRLLQADAEDAMARVEAEGAEADALARRF